MISINFNWGLFNYLFSFNYFKNFFVFFFDIISSVLFSTNSFIFGVNVGWKHNFLHLFNIIKNVFVFIWDIAESVLPFLKIISYFYEFFLAVYVVFKKIGNTLLVYLQQLPDYIGNKELLGAVSATAAGPIIQKIGNGIMAFGITNPYVLAAGAGISAVGGALTTGSKYVLGCLGTIVSFAFKIIVVIGNYLASFILKMIDVANTILKLWHVIIKNIIILIRYIFSFIIVFIYLWTYEKIDENTYYIEKL